MLAQPFGSSDEFVLRAGNVTVASGARSVDVPIYADVARPSAGFSLCIRIDPDRVRWTDVRKGAATSRADAVLFQRSELATGELSVGVVMALSNPQNPPLAPGRDLHVLTLVVDVPRGTAPGDVPIQFGRFGKRPQENLFTVVDGAKTLSARATTVDGSVRVVD